MTEEREGQQQKKFSEMRAGAELEMIMPESGGLVSSFQQEEKLFDTSSSQLSLHLLLEEDLAHYPCDFWIGLSRPGTFRPFKDEINFEPLSFFERIAIDGLAGEGPIMLCDHQKSFYVLPSPDLISSYPESWLRNLYTQLSQVKRPSVGFYFSSHVLAQKQAINFLQELLLGLLKVVSNVSFYLLLHSSQKVSFLSELIDFSHSLREEKINLCVYH